MTTLEYCIGRYTYYASSTHSYNLNSAYWLMDPCDTSIQSYDLMLHQSLDKIFREHCLSSSDQIKEFLRGPQLKSIIKPILDQETILSRHFSKEEMGKLSLLWIAVLCCYEKSAELLVRSGADVNELFGRRDPQVIHENWTVLHVLVRMDPSPENERLIRLVMDQVADLQARDYLGQTFLHIAVRGSRVEMTKMLLEKGADVNATDNCGETPLFFAAGNSKVNELLPLLMKHGGDVFVKSRRGQNTLHRLACAPGKDLNVDLARVLIEKGVSLDEKQQLDDYQPLHLAALTEKNELVKLFLDHGANVNALTKLHQSSLHIAAKCYDGHRVTKTLLERGANVDLRTINGHTALHVACEHAAWLYSDTSADVINSKNTIRLLLSAGANVLAEDYDGKTPFALLSPGVNARDPVTQPIMRELALRKAHLQPPIELKDEEIIERYPKLRDYYRKCSEEIDRTKSTRFIETCTFFDLLAKSQCQIAELMRNPEFEAKFKQCDLSGFSKYAGDIARAFERAERCYRSMLEQENVISEAVYDVLPYLVVRKVVYYMFDC